MSAVRPIQPLEAEHPIDKTLNEFCLMVGTVNGSGSQTSNMALMRALLKMGIPVAGKNLFPSNIQGQPTWFTIRVNKDGWQARREKNDIVVAMNLDSFKSDLESLLPGGSFFYADHIKSPISRSDIVVYPMPVQKLARESDAPTSLRSYIANMVYVGVLAQNLGLELDKIYQALQFHFKGKQKPIDMNFKVVEAAANWASENLEKKDPFYVEPMEAGCEYSMVEGNTAAALGSIFGGVQFASWYPITPASSLAETLMEYGPSLRKDPETGKNTLVILQAEDELAAAGMITGAGWAGLRAMTSTSGPGLSLMTEYVGLAYYAEVPIVIWDIQRVGPSTGLPTRTAQGDLTTVYFLGHGDTQHAILLPGNVTECFEFGWRSFDLAERLQTPVFVLSDLDLGMNNWMSKPFEYPDQPMDRGKVLWEGELDRLDFEWGRYKDIDGDGIAYRTIPGNRHSRGAYFARGTGHDENARYTESAETWERMMNRLKLKFETARKLVPTPVIENTPDAEIGIVAFGSTDFAVQEARYLLANRGIKTNYMRIRALPFSSQVENFIQNQARTYVIELNRDGQMNQLLKMEYPQHAVSLISLAHMDGMPLSAHWVEESILSKEEKTT
jgi:2-oxoglutarate/2-oxoacid ferredoxin oxidoreductase subunit alpha